jgi:hypothetical protein
VGILADHLEERGAPRVPELRALMARYADEVRWAEAMDWSRRRDGTRWESVTTSLGWLRLHVGWTFGRRWRWMNVTRLARITGVLPKQ